MEGVSMCHDETGQSCSFSTFALLNSYPGKTNRAQ